MASIFRTFLEKLGGSTAASYVGTKGDLFFDPDQAPTPILKVSDGSTTGGIAVTGVGSGTMGGVMTSHIIPDTNDAYDLGSAEFKIRDAYISENTIYMGDHATIKSEGTAIVVQDFKTGDMTLDNTHRSGNSVDGTSGSWTFQEGTENLFLLNNITGKKYKINLTEI